MPTKEAVTLSPKGSKSELSGIVESMQPRDAELFASILFTHSNVNYAGNKTLPPEPKKFTADALAAFAKSTNNGKMSNFLLHNQIEYLGGKNSRNYLITPPNAEPPFVLKLENRMGMPKDAETFLRSIDNSERLVPIYADREVYLKDDNKFPIRSIIVTDYCPSGDLLVFAKQEKDTELLGYFKNALLVYSQMAEILTNLSKNKLAFPDMKNTNWVMGEDDLIRISDGKSLTGVSKEGNVLFSPSSNKIITTLGYQPPELGQRYLNQMQISFMRIFLG